MSDKAQAGTKPHSDGEAKELMRRVGWLSRTPDAFANEVLSRCRLLSFGAGEPIYNVGDPPGGLYGLVLGGAAITMAPGERGPYFAHLMRSGTWFGLAAVLHRQPRNIGLTAARDSQLLLLAMNEFDTIVAEDPGAWRHFAVMSLINSNLAMAAADDLLIRNPARRCVATLLRLAGLRHSADASLVQLEVDVTQEELAYLSNLSRNAVGSVLRSIHKRGLLILTYKRIRIVDPKALQAFVAEDDQA